MSLLAQSRWDIFASVIFRTAVRLAHKDTRFCRTCERTSQNGGSFQRCSEAGNKYRSNQFASLPAQVAAQPASHVLPYSTAECATHPMGPQSNQSDTFLWTEFACQRKLYPSSEVCKHVPHVGKSVLDIFCVSYVRCIVRCGYSPSGVLAQ